MTTPLTPEEHQTLKRLLKHAIYAHQDLPPAITDRFRDALHILDVDAHFPAGHNAAHDLSLRPEIVKPATKTSLRNDDLRWP